MSLDCALRFHPAGRLSVWKHNVDPVLVINISDVSYNPHGTPCCRKLKSMRCICQDFWMKLHNVELKVKGLACVSDWTNTL